MVRSVPRPRNVLVAFVGVALLLALPGCFQSTEIPLIEFPKGAPPPQPPAKGSVPPSGAATSQGEPAH